MDVSPYYISIINKYLSQYDIYELVELKRKIKNRNNANNLNSVSMLRTINNLLVNQ
ncbi:16392_t:CDS:1, partial [Funneliformis mosseae]